MDQVCHDGMCAKCAAGKWIAFGLILIINQIYLMWDVWAVIGILFVLKGLLKMLKPMCQHCESMPMKKAKK